LKRYFFGIINSLKKVKGKLKENKTSRLPFWSPANSDAQKKSFNEKVNEGMRIR